MKLQKNQIWYAILLVILFSIFCQERVFAEDSRITVNGNTYQAFHIGGYTWQEAAEYCQNLDGHLVTITSQEEQEVVEKLLSSDKEF